MAKSSTGFSDALKEFKLTPLNPSDPAVKKFTNYVESERRREMELKSHSIHVVAQIRRFNATKDLQKKAEIFEYFLDCPVLCRFVFKKTGEEIRSEKQIEKSPPIGGLDSRKIMLRDGGLIILERSVERVGLLLQGGKWKERKKILLSAIEKVEKKRYVENAYILVISLK